MSARDLLHSRFDDAIAVWIDRHSILFGASWDDDGGVICFGPLMIGWGEMAQ